MLILFKGRIFRMEMNQSDVVETRHADRYIGVAREEAECVSFRRKSVLGVMGNEPEFRMRRETNV